MPDADLLCRVGTTFTKTGEFDEEAYRAYLQRFVDLGIGVYLASGASGEGHALTHDECLRIYRSAIAACNGKVVVGSNPPEQHTAEKALVHARIGVEAGVDVCNIYGPAGWHGFRATAAEYLDFFDCLLSEIKHPIALCPNPVIGYTPDPATVAEICRKYHQVESINLSGLAGDTYFVNLKDALTRDVDIYVAFPGSLNVLEMGAKGLINAEANFIPATFRQLLDNYAAEDLDASSDTYASIKRAAQYIGKWHGASPRWIKLVMMAFNLPGAEGGLREPYLQPDGDEIERFATGAIALNIPEVNDMARAAGRSVGKSS